MVDITPLMAADQKMIQSYTGGQFKVSGQLYSGAILVLPKSVSSWSNPAIGSRDPQFEGLLGHIDVLLIGAGAQFSVLPPSKRAAYLDLGFSVDLMDTPAACRTFNVLNAEGRRVAAALIPV